MAVEVVVVGLVALVTVICIAVLGVVALAAGGKFSLKARQTHASRKLDVEASGAPEKERVRGNSTSSA